MPSSAQVKTSDFCAPHLDTRPGHPNYRVSIYLFSLSLIHYFLLTYLLMGVVNFVLGSSIAFRSLESSPERFKRETNCCRIVPHAARQFHKLQDYSDLKLFSDQISFVKCSHVFPIFILNLNTIFLPSTKFFSFFLISNFFSNFEVV